MVLLEMPAGTVAKPHYHEAHETVIFALEGATEMRHGPNLEHVMRVEAGDFVYIPAGVPHQPYNPTDSVASRDHRPHRSKRAGERRPARRGQAGLAHPTDSDSAQPNQSHEFRPAPGLPRNARIRFRERIWFGRGSGVTRRSLAILPGCMRSAVLLRSSSTLTAPTCASQGHALPGSQTLSVGGATSASSFGAPIRRTRSCCTRAARALANL